MPRKLVHSLLLGAAVLTNSACGGGGSSGSHIVSTPPPPPSPATVAAGVLEKAPFGVTSTTKFATEGADLDVRWNAELKAYEITVPGYALAKAIPNQPGSSVGKLIASDGTILPWSVFARPDSGPWEPYSYTTWIELRRDGNTPLITAYGLSTPQGSVPTVGSATYKAEIHGAAEGPTGYAFSVYGDAAFTFDFGAGTLAGYMEPKLNGPMDIPPPLSRYEFAQTNYSSGSTTFSGKFDIAGPTTSSFQGRFTGSSAQELMANWTAPYVTWDNAWGVMEGVMIGKRR